MSTKQGQFDFGSPVRSDQLNTLDRWDVPGSFSGVSGTAIKGVLRAIDARCRGGWGFGSEQDIMLLSGLKSERHVRRAIRALENLGVLVVKRKSRGSARVTLNHYRICFANMKPDYQPDFLTDQPDFLTDQPDFLTDQPDFLYRSTGLGSPPNRIEAHKEPPPPTPSGPDARPAGHLGRAAAVRGVCGGIVLSPATATGPDARPAGHDTERTAVDAFERALEATGLDGWRRAVRIAADAGIGPDEGLRIVETYQANRKLFSHPGAVLYRLREGCWPADGVRDPKEIAEATARRDEAARKLAEQAAQDRCAADDLRAQYRQLEAAHGQRLNELSKAEQRDLARRMLPAEQVPFATRFDLLQAMRMSMSRTVPCEAIGSEL